MIRHAPLALALLLAACGEDGGGDTGAGGDARDPGDTGADGGAGPEDAGPADTGGTFAAEVTGISTRLAEAMGSVVYVAWEQGTDATVWVEFSVDEGIWMRSPAEAVAAGSREQALLGIPFGAEATFRIANEIDGAVAYSAEQRIEAGPLPGDVPEPVVLSSSPADQDPESRFLLVSLNASWDSGYLGADYWAFIFDRQGRVVWALETPLQRVTIHPRISWDGADILIDHNSYWGAFDGGAASEILRVKIDGSVTDTHPVPGLHHPFTDRPDGALAWGSVSAGYADETLELLLADGTREAIWSCADLLAELGAIPGNYCGSNTLNWIEDRGSFLFSFFSFETVVEVDGVSGTSAGWFGHLPGAWAFEPPEGAFWWQHGPTFTEAGTLLISSKDEDGGSETVAREYALDQASETLTLIWSFGEGEGVYGAEMGEAHRLGNGNTLHNYGSNARLREVTPEGEVVWDVSWLGAHYLGRSTFIPDLYALMP